jgi:hypothetical protein
MWESTARADDPAGPVEYLIVEFPAGRIPADAFHQLLGLARDDRVRLLDLEFVAVDATGAVALMDADDVVSRVGDELAAFAGASSGLLDGDDVQRVGELIGRGNVAAVVVYESTWVTSMAVQLSRSNAAVIAMGQIPMDDLDALLTRAGA